MASVWRHPKSKYWTACFTDSAGKQKKRSTRLTNRKAALLVAEKLEDAYRKRLSEDQIRRVMADIYTDIHGDSLTSSTISDFLAAWLKRKEVETKLNTFRKYQSVVKQFLTFLGERASRDLNFLTSKEVADYRDSIAQRLTPSTANLALKVLRVAFHQAFKDGLIQASPADRVSIISRKGEESRRRAFTLPELRILLHTAAGEWKGLILGGLYTGQRLKDVATLTWQNVDLERDELRLVTGKTGRRQILPIASPLKRYFAEIPAGDDPKAPLFPRAFGEVEKTGDVRRLSGQFGEILAEAGLAKPPSKAATGGGRSVRRETSELSYHSLRHTATSLMKNAGISPAIVQDVIGHESAAVSAHYTHIEDEAKRRAIDSIPDLL